MSSPHIAVYSPMKLSHEEALERVLVTLEDRGAVFDGGLRGMHWDEVLDSFAYDSEEDHELEGLDSATAAVARSKTFERTLLDVRFLKTTLEVQCLAQANERQVSIAFSSSLFGLAQNDVELASRWLDAMSAVASVLGDAQMVCGAAVEERPFSTAELMKTLEERLRGPQPGGLGLHTAICNPRVVGELDRQKLIPAAMSRSHLASGHVLLSSLLAPQGA